MQENGRMFLSDIHRLEKCIVTVLEALLDEKEISRLTGRAIPTLQKDRLNGEGPPFVKIGRLSAISRQPCRLGWTRTPGNQLQTDQALSHDRACRALEARPMTAPLKSWARALGGEVSGNSVRAPGPGHSRIDRSLSVTVSHSSPDGFVVFSHAGDDWQACRDYVRGKVGLSPFRPGQAPNVAPGNPSRKRPRTIANPRFGSGTRPLNRAEHWSRRI